MRILVLIVLWASGLKVYSQNPDIDLLKQIHIGRNTGLDGVFQLVSSSVTPLTIGAPLGLAGYSHYKKDSVLAGKFPVIAGSAILASLLTTTIKFAVSRERPFEAFPAIRRAGNTDPTPSFPSGHTSSAFATATSFSMAFPRWYVIAPAYSWAAAVAYSRMHMGMHYPSDVAAGALIGAGSTWLCYKLNRKFFHRPATP